VLNGYHDKNAGKPKNASSIASDNKHLVDITFAEIDGKLNHNEPIYCFCNYISYGNMVKCDNPKVYIICYHCIIVYKGMVSLSMRRVTNIT